MTHTNENDNHRLNNFKKFLRRVIPISTALWMLVDFGLDINQTIIYYNASFGNTWAIYQTVVSPGYFYAALAIWAIPPVLFSIISTLIFKVPASVIAKTFVQDLDEVKNKYSAVTRFTLFILLLPFDILAAVLLMYIAFPFLALQHGYNVLIDKDDDDDVFRMLHNHWHLHCLLSICLKTG